MNATSIILIFLCALSPLACGKSAPEQEPLAEKAAAPKDAAVESRPDTSSTPGSDPGEAPTDLAAYTGELTFTDTKNPWKETGSVTFTVEDGALRGRAEVSGTTLRVQGFVDEGALRAWLGSDRAEAQTPRAGYLHGKIEGNEASGTFAMSAVKAETAGRGTWRAHRSAEPKKR